MNSKCKMLTLKAKHATMLLTVSEVDGLSDGLEELEDEEEEMPKHPPTHPSVVMVSDYLYTCWDLGGCSFSDKHPMGLLFLPQYVPLHCVSLLLFVTETGNRMRVLVGLDFVNTIRTFKLPCVASVMIRAGFHIKRQQFSSRSSCVAQSLQTCRERSVALRYFSSHWS